MYKFLLASLLFASVISAHSQTKKIAVAPKKNVVAAEKKTTAVPVLKTTGRNINITLTPFKNCWIYLGSYYGKGKTLADSAYLDGNSKGTFKSEAKLTGGIYFVVSPQYTIQFELLMDHAQHFSIVGDSAQKEKVQIIGSPDNDLFKSYSAISAVKGRQRYNLEMSLSSAKNASDSNKIKSEIAAIDTERQDYIDNFIQKYPNSLLGMLLP